MADKELEDCRDVLFGYFSGPSFGRSGKDDGGFSINFYEDGRAVHKTYIFPKRIRTETEYQIEKDAVAAIKTFIEEHQTEIDAFGEYLDGGMCDGPIEEFIFNGKQIIAISVFYNDEDHIKDMYRFCSQYDEDRIKDIYRFYPRYYAEYFSGENISKMEKENALITLSFAVIEILKSYGVSIDREGVNFTEIGSQITEAERKRWFRRLF